MSKIKTPEKVIPFAGVLLSDISLLDEGKKSLESIFGPIDLQTRVIPFTHTSYYNSEMGEHIVRLWVRFSGMFDPEHLYKWKIESNHIEETWAHMEADISLRRINIDPGYVTEAKIVLASTKNFSHRIYLRSGIYAEVTLNYRRDRGWQFFDWTYPDYKEKTALDFFTLARNKLLSAKRSMSSQYP